MHLLSALVPAALVAAAAAQATADGPLPTSIPYADVVDIIELKVDEYPLAVSNDTHYFIYLLNTTSMTAQSGSGAVEKRSPGWTWWQPYPGEPAWKKAKRDAVAAPEADAAPRWTWWQPYPGEPAWKKTKREAAAAPDAAPDAAAAPGWTWWQPYPGEPAWKKTKRDAKASPGWTWWQPYPGEPAW